MWLYGMNDVNNTKALDRMYDELFDDDGNVNTKKVPRIRREFIAKMNQDPIMRYDWRHWNVGVFDAKVFAKMCEALQIRFEVRKKEDDSVVSTTFDHSSPFRNVPVVDLINTLDYVGLYVTLDGVKIQNFDYCHHANSYLGAKQ